MSNFAPSIGAKRLPLGYNSGEAQADSLGGAVRGSIGGSSTEQSLALSSSASPLDFEPKLWRAPSQQFQSQNSAEGSNIKSKFLHTEFIPISIHTAICDRCNKRNSSILQRCCACNKQHCYNCMYDGGGDRIHMPVDGEVDWTDRGAHSRSKTRNAMITRGKGKPFNITQGVRRSPRTLQKIEEPLRLKGQSLILANEHSFERRNQDDETGGIFVIDDGQTYEGALSNDTNNKSHSGDILDDEKMVNIDDLLDTIPIPNHRKQLIYAGQVNTGTEKKALSAENFMTLRKDTNSLLVAATSENNDAYRRCKFFSKRAEACEDTRQTSPQVMALIRDGQGSEAEQMLEAASILHGMARPQ